MYVIAYLLMRPLQDLSINVISQLVPLILTILLAYLGFQVGFRRREEFVNLLNVSRKERDKKRAATGEAEAAEQTNQPKAKILDTSVIIDGRIADICQTSYLEGPIVIPQLV